MEHDKSIQDPYVFGATHIFCRDNKKGGFNPNKNTLEPLQAGINPFIKVPKGCYVVNSSPHVNSIDSIELHMYYR